MLAVKSGKAIRFEEDKTRPMGRNASGVRGIKLASSSDEVVGMVTVNNPKEETILVVSEHGYGKRTFIDDEDGEQIYRITNRGGKGVKTITISEKTGALVAMKSVADDDDLMIIKKSGVAIRMSVNELRVMGRAAQGVKLINLKDDDSIAAVAKIAKQDDEDTIEVESSDQEINENENNKND